jgi:hypothetical protein
MIPSNEYAIVIVGEPKPAPTIKLFEPPAIHLDPFVATYKPSAVVVPGVPVTDAATLFVAVALALNVYVPAPPYVPETKPTIFPPEGNPPVPLVTNCPNKIVTLVNAVTTKVGLPIVHVALNPELVPKIFVPAVQLAPLSVEYALVEDKPPEKYPPNPTKRLLGKVIVFVLLELYEI